VQKLGGRLANLSRILYARLAKGGAVLAVQARERIGGGREFVGRGGVGSTGPGQLGGNR
jgi:hypothetical protein